MQLPKIELSQEQVMTMLETGYSKAINGIPGSLNCQQLAYEYLSKYPTKQIAAQKLIQNQIAKCATSGFVTGLGGLPTMPITLPANIASVLYVQMRMIAGVAAIGGYDVQSDEVQTLVYTCLVGSSIADLCKSVGIQIGNKISMNLLKKLPAKILTKINQKIGFRLLTKFGEKGVIRLANLVPVAGGVIGGSVDFVGTKAMGKHAYKMFIENVLE